MPSPGSLGASATWTKRSRDYRRWRGIQRDLIRVLLAGEKDWPVPADWIVGAAFSFGATFASPPDAHRRNDGTVDLRTARDVLAWDLRNLEKAAEDVLAGLVWKDDRQVRFAGPGAAFDTKENWWSVHLWATSPDEAFDVKGKARMHWQSAWEEMSVPYRVRLNLGGKVTDA